MKSNPFTLDFGTEPGLYIPRLPEYNRILETFEADEPSSHIFILTGVRGSGKTVLMTTMSHKLGQSKKWMHIDLNTEGDMLNQLASAIYNSARSKKPKIKLEVNVKGLSLSVDKEEKYHDIQTDIDSMLGTLNKQGVKLLITIDELLLPCEATRRQQAQRLSFLLSRLAHLMPLQVLWAEQHRL